MRTAVPSPARPVPSRNIVVGSGTVLIVPLMLAWELAAPKFAVPPSMKVPLAPANKPVPPVNVKIFSKGAIPNTGGSVIVPAAAPKKVLPPPKSNVKRPLEILPVATLVQ